MFKDTVFAELSSRYQSLIERSLSTILTSASASRIGNPTTNTKFFCTTLTFARCFRFSVTLCFRC